MSFTLKSGTTRNPKQWSANGFVMIQGYDDSTDSEEEEERAKREQLIAEDMERDLANFSEDDSSSSDDEEDNSNINQAPNSGRSKHWNDSIGSHSKCSAQVWIKPRPSRIMTLLDSAIARRATTPIDGLSKPQKMRISHVNMSTEVFFVCLNHAMSTDGEEIVGLLVGEVDENHVVHVHAIVILRRSDKRKDRVEISPEQLSHASTEAERLACILKKPIRVIGWYHSHPKLSVWPSFIDVNTQDSYQLMDENFIGIIFSVFNEDPSKKGGRIQMTCFQTQSVIQDGPFVDKKSADVPIRVIPTSHLSQVCMSTLAQIPRYLLQEEQHSYQLARLPHLDYLTRTHNSGVYLKSLGQIAEVIFAPLLKMLEERIYNNELKRKKLQERKEDLQLTIQQILLEKLHINEASESHVETMVSV